MSKKDISITDALFPLKFRFAPDDWWPNPRERTKNDPSELVVLFNMLNQAPILLKSVLHFIRKSVKPGAEDGDLSNLDEKGTSILEKLTDEMDHFLTQFDGLRIQNVSNRTHKVAYVVVARCLRIMSLRLQKADKGTNEYGKYEMPIGVQTAANAGGEILNDSQYKFLAYFQVSLWKLSNYVKTMAYVYTDDKLFDLLFELLVEVQEETRTQNIVPSRKPLQDESRDQLDGSTVYKEQQNAKQTKFDDWGEDDVYKPTGKKNEVVTRVLPSQQPVRSLNQRKKEKEKEEKAAKKAETSGKSKNKDARPKPTAEEPPKIRPRPILAPEPAPPTFGIAPASTSTNNLAPLSTWHIDNRTPDEIRNDTERLALVAKETEAKRLQEAAAAQLQLERRARELEAAEVDRRQREEATRQAAEVERQNAEAERLRQAAELERQNAETAANALPTRDEDLDLNRGSPPLERRDEERRLRVFPATETPTPRRLSGRKNVISDTPDATEQPMLNAFYNYTSLLFQLYVLFLQDLHDYETRIFNDARDTIFHTWLMKRDFYIYARQVVVARLKLNLKVVQSDQVRISKIVKDLGSIKVRKYINGKNSAFIKTCGEAYHFVLKDLYEFLFEMVSDFDFTEPSRVDYLIETHILDSEHTDLLQFVFKEDERVRDEEANLYDEEVPLAKSKKSTAVSKEGVSKKRKDSSNEEEERPKKKSKVSKAAKEPKQAKEPREPKAKTGKKFTSTTVKKWLETKVGPGVKPLTYQALTFNQSMSHDFPNAKFANPADPRNLEIDQVTPEIYESLSGAKLRDFIYWFGAVPLKQQLDIGINTVGDAWQVYYGMANKTPKGHTTQNLHLDSKNRPNPISNEGAPKKQRAASKKKAPPATVEPPVQAPSPLLTPNAPPAPAQSPVGEGFHFGGAFIKPVYWNNNNYNPWQR